MKPFIATAIITLFLFSKFGVCQIAGGDYQIEKQDSSFFFVQNGLRVPFDTAQVQVNLIQKSDEVIALETEIGLLERLVVLRRQLAVAREEKRTLLDIIEKARKCETTSSKK
ncbi:MAG: hypothetical protein R3D58_07060 [Saprospiraceae bacterium]|nr:hypothetical protein [Lewinellaceae bacterium]